jgi:hypothetical protein
VVGREQTDLRRVTKLLEDVAERFMYEAAFAGRSRKAHLLISPDTPPVLAQSKYADGSMNVVLIRRTKRCMVTRIRARSIGQPTRVDHMSTELWVRARIGLIDLLGILQQLYSTFSVCIHPDIVSLQLCIPKFVGA